jgi:hypothetical protein
VVPDFADRTVRTAKAKVDGLGGDLAGVDGLGPLFHPRAHVLDAQASEWDRLERGQQPLAPVDLIALSRARLKVGPPRFIAREAPPALMGWTDPDTWMFSKCSHGARPRPSRSRSVGSPRPYVFLRTWRDGKTVEVREYRTKQEALNASQLQQR